MDSLLSEQPILNRNPCKVRGGTLSSIHTLHHESPKGDLTSVFVTKTRKGFSGSFLYYQNTAMNRMHYRQFSVLLIANGDPVAAIYHLLKDV